MQRMPEEDVGQIPRDLRSAWIVAIGTELALGQAQDTNSAWLAQRLAALGVRADRHVVVADELAAIRAVLSQAAAAGDLVLVTGGLGPTDDDVTRAALAKAAGVGLEEDAASVERLQAFFARRGREMPERNRVQALIPRTGLALPNQCGTAPGIHMLLEGTPCYVLPGVPFEMRAMYEAEVEPVVRAAAAGAVLRSRRLHTFGAGESDVGLKIRDLMARGRNPEVGTTAEIGVVSVRINARGRDAAEADGLLDEAEAEIRRRLGPLVYGRDSETLGGVVGERLVELGWTLSTAESCTGGLISQLLTDVPGSSRYFLGGLVTYSNALKTGLVGVDQALLMAHGAVSEPVAVAMADGAARVTGSDVAVSVTGVAGPGGGSVEKPVGLVFIGLHTCGACAPHAFRFGEDHPREVIRMRAARMALHLVRTSLPDPPAARPGR
jgi:nicotinamide-nucleotide amidase